MGRGPKPAKGKAKPPVSRKSPKNDGARVRDLEKRLAEALKREAEALGQLQTRDRELAQAREQVTAAQAQVNESLEQQTATGDILRVIARSPTDTQPVFEAIAQNAMRLCDGSMSVVSRYDGELIHLGAYTHVSADGVELIRRRFPMQPMRDNLYGRVVFEGGVVHIPDVYADSEFDQAISQALGIRSILGVPMLLDGRVVGAIATARPDVRPFTDKQIDLLKTFADQAVIAIENVRLFTELRASNRELSVSLDKQTATADILRVISGSRTDVQPVFDAIVQSAVRLLGADSGILARIAGDQLELAAHTSTDEAGDAAQRALFPWPLKAEGPMAVVIRDRVPLNIVDVQSDERLSEASRAAARARGSRSRVTVPLLRHDAVIGMIGLSRREPGGFAADEIALLQTFADQAVIAIENVRLFTELEARNRDLTATSEILQVISRSPTNVQPVFEAIAESAARLTNALHGITFLVADNQLHLAAVHLSAATANRERFARAYPIPLDDRTLATRIARDGVIVNMADIETDPSLPEPQRQRARMLGVRALLAVPMLREGRTVGMVFSGRTEAGAFTDQQVAVLKTFADQAVIAIENVRLFKELQEKNQALTEAHAQVTESLEQQTATSEILRVISQSPTDVQPVFEAIVASAVRLLRGHSGALTRIVGDQIELAALTRTDDAGDAARRAAFPQSLHSETVPAQAIRQRMPVNIADARTDPRLPETEHGRARARGYRSWINVPMLRHNKAIGTIAVTRREPGGFNAEEIALLQTFADQAVIAIENVRLFKELEVANRELAAASQHKSEFLANMSHELRTPLNAIIGFSEVLSERMFGELNEKQEEYSKDIHASGQHLLSLINDILDLSKIEAGRMELELTDFDLPQAIDSALTLVRERAGRRGIALQMNVDSRLDQMRADERKVRQVVLNLLSNAIKFTPEGGRIEVIAAPRDGAVEISVSDTGVGIAPEDQEAVFEEFRQVGTADKKVEGTGLGLTLCRKFVELHGGRIWVKSQVGAGSTFTFTIPGRHSE